MPRVVIAEDEAIIRLDLKELLEEEGYEVVGETGRGDEAIELVRELAPTSSILDIKMPGLDGLTAARTIAGERLAAVLILTAFSQRDLVEQARDAGRARVPREAVPEERPHPGDRGGARPVRRRARRARARASPTSQERLEARKLIDRAKGRLMDEHGLDEQAAVALPPEAGDERPRARSHEVAAARRRRRRSIP